MKFYFLLAATSVMMLGSSCALGQIDSLRAAQLVAGLGTLESVHRSMTAALEGVAPLFEGQVDSSGAIQPWEVPGSSWMALAEDNELRTGDEIVGATGFLRHVRRLYDGVNTGQGVPDWRHVGMQVQTEEDEAPAGLRATVVMERTTRGGAAYSDTMLLDLVPAPDAPGALLVSSMWVKGLEEQAQWGDDLNHPATAKWLRSASCAGDAGCAALLHRLEANERHVEQQVRDWLEATERLMGEGRLDEAEAALRRAERDRTRLRTNREIRDALGLATEEWEEALALAAQNQTERIQRRKDSLVEAGDRMGRHGEFLGAVQAFASLMEQHPDDADISKKWEQWSEQDRAFQNCRRMAENPNEAEQSRDRLREAAGSLGRGWGSHFDAQHQWAASREVRNREERQASLKMALDSVSKSIEADGMLVPPRLLRIDIVRDVLKEQPDGFAGDVDMLMQDYRRVAAISFESASHAREGGQYFERRGRLDCAERVLESAWKPMAIADRDLRMELAVDLVGVQGTLDHHTKANRVLEELVRVDPRVEDERRFWEAKLKLVLIEGQSKRINRAIRDFENRFNREIKELVFRDLKDHFSRLGEEFLQAGRMQFALFGWKPLRHLNPSAEDLLKVGRLASEVGELHFADTVLSEGLQLSPHSDALFLAKVQNQLRLGNVDFDLQRLQRLADGRGAGRDENLAYLEALCRTDVAEAKKFRGVFKKRFAGQKATWAYADHVYQREGKKKASKADKALKKWMDIRYTGEALFEYGCAKLGWSPCCEHEFSVEGVKTGALSEVKDLFEESVNLDQPAEPWLVARSLGWLNWRLDDAKETMIWLQRAAEQEPTDIESRLLHAVVALYENEWEEAEASFSSAVSAGLYLRSQDARVEIELRSLEALIYLGLDWLEASEEDRTKQRVDGAIRRIKEVQKSHPEAVDVPVYHLLDIASWVILYEDLALDKIEHFNRAVLIPQPMEWLDPMKLDGNEVVKELRKSKSGGEFKEGWNAYLDRLKK